MNYRDAVTLRAEFLGALLQDRADYVPNAELLDFALHQELGPMVYFHWHDLLPEDCVGIFRKSYMASAAMDMKFSAAYTEIKNILEFNYNFAICLSGNLVLFQYMVERAK